MNLKKRLRKAEEAARARTDAKKKIFYRAVFGPHDDDDVPPGTIVYKCNFDDLATNHNEEEEEVE